MGLNGGGGHPLIKSVRNGIQEEGNVYDIRFPKDGREFVMGKTIS